MNFDLKILKWNEQGLIPAIVQEYDSREVLMLAYMNEEALTKTLSSKVAHYYSRSRKELWKKGETSGNFQFVKELTYDCDADTILLKVNQVGVACHTGSKTCFFNTIPLELNEEPETNIKKTQLNILDDLYEVIKYRKGNPLEGSYTSYLFEKGIDKILKKVGEETSEVIIGAKNNDESELVYEISDLVYHLLVLMVNQNVTLDTIEQELKKRRS
ncbi:bifunctional phosphoribosyl-AMP cyclohydrolase/phosphoribosyl-ATP diphosphatase HisIE [Haloplasma contractile]|uniref:Histidine biosynthesis bifunctional protein HisIE n=1 Tax=Haloplasma contractile SSD-17B TaxID=1033810 RepID=U2FGD7_9MOLU|nr:bifunctional phosphoribosyl-AMP cyclohydrolase/phosphoribosyl-ATP diphosphatase HisIE [Haloplasma contractile]ERJ11940.1 Histidine biosynthesis bifunctional protein HisIE [Haloplasma contractile SSD-17B]